MNNQLGIDYSQTAVIDTNLLLLLVVGLIDKNQIGVASRIEKYSLKHFEALHDLCFRFQSRAVTPHILTETSNLGRLVFNGHLRHAFADQLTKIIDTQLNSWTENHIPFSTINPSMHRALGLTDAALLGLPSNCIFISDDGPLTNYLHTQGRSTFRFIDLWNQID